MVKDGGEAAAPGKGAKGRLKTEGSSDATSTNSSTNALRFLERSERPSQTSPVFPDAVVTNPWPIMPVGSQPAARPSAWAVHSTQAPRFPRNSPLAFLERDTSTLSVSSLVAASGSDAGLGSLHTPSRGGRVASCCGSRDDLSTRPCAELDGRRCELEEEEEQEDDNVCPSMLFSCLPCLSCLRPGRRRRQLEGDPLHANNIRKDSILSQGSLGTPLLSDEPLSPRNFPKDVKLIEVEVESARNVPLGAKEAIAKSAGTYVSLRMTPAQEGVGEQTEYTSIATRVVNPRWGGRETFTFFVTDTQHSKAMLALSLMYRPLQSPPGPPPRRAHGATEAIGAGAAAPSGYRPGDVVIGEGFVDLLGVFPVHNGTYTPGRHKGNSRRVAVPIREPMGKRRTKCSVMLGLRCRRVNETIDTHEDRLYEYQRWTRLAGWSTAGKPRVGKWSTVDGTVFSDDFAEVAPPAREDSEVVLPWCPFGGWEYSREDETTPPAIARNTPNRDEVRPSKGPEDWENFTVGRKGAVWMEGHVSGYDSVRRRLWRRVYLDRGSSSVGLSAMTT